MTDWEAIEAVNRRHAKKRRYRIEPFVEGAACAFGIMALFVLVGLAVRYLYLR